MSLPDIPECADRESTVINCPLHKQQGYCEDYPEFMSKYCRLTCEFCTVQDEEEYTEEDLIPVEDDCHDAEDAAEWCNDIVEEGNCNGQFHYDWAAENCRASCQFCRLPSF